MYKCALEERRGVGQVQTYKRKITYFYQYQNGNLGSTAGFLKMEIRGDRVKIIINIQEPIGLPYKRGDLYFYHEAGDHLHAIKVDEITSVNAVLTYHERLDWKQFYHTGRDLYTFDGALVVYNKNHYYIGDFNDKNRNGIPIEYVDESKIPTIDTTNIHKVKMEPEALSKEKIVEDYHTDNIIKNEKTEQVKNEKLSKDFFSCENCPYQEKRKELKQDVDSFEQMLAEYPKITFNGMTDLFQCVRIHPRDIGKLDIKNWRLGVNSFLTHGFFTYQYILLGKLRFENGTDKPILGVPGVYTNREKYLANMFGFELFIPVHNTGIKTGEFGYWIVELN